mgnify:CR=1 FL=1
MAVTFAQAMFGQATLVGLGAFQILASGVGLVTLAILLYTYFRTRDASFWKTDTVRSIYMLALVVSMAPMNVEAFTQALGPIAGTVATLLQILLTISGMIAVYPTAISGAVVYAVEYLDDFFTYAKEGTLGKKYPIMD